MVVGIMLYLREDIPANLLNPNFPFAQIFSIEISLYKKNSLLTVLIRPTRVTFEIILISSIAH